MGTIMAISCPAGRMRVVIVDPSYGSPVGHHQELNSALLAALMAAGHWAEVWADEALAEAPGLRRVSCGCGYVDPRHWPDLAGSLHLAARLRRQFEAALAADATAGVPAPAVWLAHGLLPFQQIALAQLLQHQPPARVLLSLMFAPAETLSGMAGLDPTRHRQQAGLNARTAHQALAQACRLAGHQLVLGSSSATTLALHAPLLQAAGLRPGQLHPAVVGAGCHTQSPAATDPPLVLLHWGDRKPDKGCQEALAVLQALLQRPVSARPPWRWLFHSYTQQAWPAQEQAVLEKASQQLGDALLWLDEPVSSVAMQDYLAQCAVALLAYSPITYAERSSGVLWCYAAARHAAGLPAMAAGYGGHWLQREAASLGMGWCVAPVAAGCSDGQFWLSAIEHAMGHYSQPSWLPAADQTLGRSFAAWVLEQLQLAEG
jgi:hypothetical protein